MSGTDLPWYVWLFSYAVSGTDLVQYALQSAYAMSRTERAFGGTRVQYVRARVLSLDARYHRTPSAIVLRHLYAETGTDSYARTMLCLVLRCHMVLPSSVLCLRYAVSSTEIS